MVIFIYSKTLRSGSRYAGITWRQTCRNLAGNRYGSAA